MNFLLPYGKKHLPLTLKDTEVIAVMTSKTEAYKPTLSETELVKQSLLNPIGSKPLSELAKGKNKITIIASDHTRPVPSKIIMPLMLEEIRKGNPKADITIVIATGCHRATTEAELVSKFGEKIVSEEKIVVHDCDDASMLTDLGFLPSGGKLIINRLATEADLLVSEGFIEPHFFAGFSGGRKSVLPGIASRVTVCSNHSGEFIADEKARTGNLNQNPIHVDMEYAAIRAGLKFICNVVLNGEKKIINSFSGDPVAAHRDGCEFIKSLCFRKAVPADIVITTNGGYPLDQNIYQAVKSMSTAEATVKKGGVIIDIAESGDGHGGEGFCNFLRSPLSNEELEKEMISVPAPETRPDQWQAQIMLRALRKAAVIFVSSAPKELVEELRMIYAKDLDEAIKIARKLSPDNPTFTVIPDGVSVTVTE